MKKLVKKPLYVLDKNKGYTKIYCGEQNCDYTSKKGNYIFDTTDVRVLDLSKDVQLDVYRLFINVDKDQLQNFNIANYPNLEELDLGASDYFPKNIDSLKKLQVLWCPFFTEGPHINRIYKTIPKVVFELTNLKILQIQAESAFVGALYFNEDFSGFTKLEILELFAEINNASYFYDYRTHFYDFSSTFDIQFEIPISIIYLPRLTNNYYLMCYDYINFYEVNFFYYLFNCREKHIENGELTYGSKHYSPIAKGNFSNGLPHREWKFWNDQETDSFKQRVYDYGVETGIWFTIRGKDTTVIEKFNKGKLDYVKLKSFQNSDWNNLSPQNKDNSAVSLTYECFNCSDSTIRKESIIAVYNLQNYKQYKNVDFEKWRTVLGYTHIVEKLFSDGLSIKEFYWSDERGDQMELVLKSKKNANGTWDIIEKGSKYEERLNYGLKL